MSLCSSVLISFSLCLFFFFFPDVLAQIELEIEFPFPLFSCKYLKCYRTFVSKMVYSASKNMRRLDSQIWGLFHPFEQINSIIFKKKKKKKWGWFI